VRVHFGEIYERFVGVVHGIALARVGPADADDVVQETFLAVHRGLDGLRDPAALPGWIVKIASHAAVDRLRDRSRSPRRLDLPEEIPAAAAQKDEVAELRARVLAHIQALPEAYREPLIWRLVEGLTGPEIAERTGLTPGSVRVNLHRGMAQLRAALGVETP